DGEPVAGGRGRGAGEQLGGEVAGGADEALVAAAGEAREPEVDDLEPALAGDEHVRRLEVAVEEAGPVQRVHAGGELAEREPEGGLGGRLAARAQVLEPAVPGDIFHGDVPLAAGPIERELVDGGEVGVADVDDVAELLL